MQPVVYNDKEKFLLVQPFCNHLRLSDRDGQATLGPFYIASPGDRCRGFTLRHMLCLPPPPYQDTKCNRNQSVFPDLHLDQSLTAPVTVTLTEGCFFHGSLTPGLILGFFLTLLLATPGGVALLLCFLYALNEPIDTIKNIA
jgi:hypothetical protein